MPSHIEKHKLKHVKTCWGRGSRPSSAGVQIAVPQVDFRRVTPRYTALHRITPGRSSCNNSYALCIFIALNPVIRAI